MIVTYINYQFLQNIKTLKNRRNNPSSVCNQQNYKTPTFKKQSPQTMQSYDDDFEESNQHNKKIKPNKSIDLPHINQINTKKSPQKDNIKQSEYDDHNYQDEDFQDIKHHKVSKSKQKIVSQNQYLQLPNKIKKSSSTLNTKPQKSIRQDSNKKLSLSTLKNSNVQTQSKYLSYLNTQFSHTKQQILEFQPQKINRLNEKLRNYIKKVNDQLTELINQNMRKFKTNLKTTQKKTVEDQLTILSQQKKNGEIYLDTVAKQYQSLNEKWEKVKNYQQGPNMDQQVSQITIKIKQVSKEINNLKHNVTQQGNKLTQDKNYGQKTNDLKNKLSNLKKQQQKNIQKLQKTQIRFDQLNTKTPQINYQLESLTQKAKKSNISVNSTVSDKKTMQKYEELKKKLQNQRMHKDKIESLNQTKLNILKRDNEVLKNQVTELQIRSNHVDSQMSSTKQASVAMIQQAKYQDLQPYIQTHLDFIYKNIMDNSSSSGTNQKMVRKNSTRNVTEIGSKSGIKKYASVSNVRKFERSQSDAELKPNFQIHKKSLFDQKAKQKDSLKIQNKHASQRVWKEESINQKQMEKSKQMNESSTTKPFVIRKSQNVATVSEGSPKINKLESSPNKNDEKQNQKSALLAPKMKFKKTEHQDPQLEVGKKEPTISEKNTNELKKIQKDEEISNSKPTFKIKKASKQKVQIPEEDLNVFKQESNKKIQTNLSTKKQPLEEDKEGVNQELGDQSSSKKGPNFKLFNKSKNQPRQSINQQNSIQQQIPQTNRNKSSQNIVQEINSKKEVIEEDLGINVGRRQAGRKIQRKNQDSYVV